MKYTMIFTASLLSVSLFTGCDLNKTSDNETDSCQSIQTDIHHKKTNPLQKNIAGTWLGNCHYDEDYDESYQAELIFNLDLSFNYIEKTYPTEDCLGDSYNEGNKKLGSYKIGDITRSENNEKAYEFETHSLINSQIEDKYFMVKITSSRLIFTDEKIDQSQPNGKTLQTRNNYFKEVPRITFTKKHNK
ncbi:MAG: hypothetical protein L3J43_00080 [Sulfurovum sp.]|nr:hypothetical protein [Sulfurovum sp.]